MAHQQHRIYTFDLLRGLAVLSMMLAHSIYFFHNRESDFLLTVEGFGNIVSFVTFLLVSGAVASVAYFYGNRTEAQRKRKRIFTRVVLLLFAYYLLAFFLTSQDILREEGFARLRLLFDIFLFRYLPGFTEYFPPFVFYSFFLVLTPRFFLLVGRSLKNVALVSLTALLAGFFLYELPVGPYVRPWIALFAGAEGLFRFPLLQYFPVFLLGLYWGRRTVERPGLHAKRLLCSNLFWFFALVVTASFLGSFFLGLPLQTVFSRWPPTIPFLALGLGSAFLAAVLLYVFRQLRHIALLRDILLTLGQNALGVFWSHIFLLGLYAMAGGAKVSSVGISLFLFLLLTILSLALATFLPFNFRLALTSVRKSHEEHEESLSEEAVFHLSKDVVSEATITTRGIQNYFFPNPDTTTRRVLKRRHKFAFSLIALAAAVVIFPATIEELALLRQQRNADTWWNDSYAYRQYVTLQNAESFSSIQKNTPVAMPFNHKKLVTEGKSRADGLDVKLVYWTGREYSVIESYVENPESEQATLKFRSPVQLQDGKREQFYTLYYGGFLIPQTQNFTLETSATVLGQFSEEQSYPLVASVSKSWSLIGEGDDDGIALHLITADRYDAPIVTYQISGTDLSGSMARSSETSWEAVIPVGALQPGAYQIQATVLDGEREQKSQQTGFYRSYPLYVAWTQDWEGYDVVQGYLDAMEEIADQYRVPITHFFNPRIYITNTIRPERANYLTDWVQRRLDLGDGFGLHLHMFTDFVERAGVTPKTEPNWGDRGDAYGVPMTAYTKDEQQRIIQFALELLAENGFSKTDLFRAGGWFANLDTLMALEDLGFKIDSSARTSYQFGRNRLRGYWSILPTTKPYQPSRTNQNRSSLTDPFPLLEIPNNGADSYAFSAKELIGRFTTNIEDGILDEKQQLTYLSHPHWFDEKEQGRVRELLSYVGRYTFTNDRGPVIFTTTNTIYNIWVHGE